VNPLTAEQRGLRDAVRSLLAKRSDSAAMRKAIETPRGYDEALWRVLCEQIGVAGLSIPDEYGGAGAGPLETHLVLEELGRSLTPSPLLGSAVLAGQLLLALGDAETSRRALPDIAAGASVAAVAWAGAEGAWSTDRATVRASADGTLTGQTHYVLDGDLADRLLAVAQTSDGLAVYLVQPDARGLTRTHTPTMDRTRRLARVDFAATPGDRIGGDATDALARALSTVTVAQTAEQVGAMTRIFELTVEYTKVRVQFGRPIGSFQALKHRMADLHVLVDAARSASYAALDGTIAPEVAAVYCAEAFFTVAAESIQLHGGIAITWEHDAHLYFKRAQAGTQLFGTASGRLAALAKAVGL
jgi:alkylation response protein AidB-like acyl-CoA dehydrogenase